jgi:hypothetical protein
MDVKSSCTTSGTTEYNVNELFMDDEDFETVCQASKTGDLSQLQNLFTKVASEDGAERVTSLLNMFDGIEEMRTPLHLASAAGHVDIVTYLLVSGADPSKVDVRSRLPYFDCKTKSVREAYRRVRGMPGMESKWDWPAAGVPEALTDDVEQLKKEKEREKKRRAKQRKKETKEKDEVAAKQAEEERKRQASEAASALAARMRGAGVCGMCEKPLFGIATLDIFDRRCCSSACVVALRRKLAGEAALKRFEKK